MEEHPTPDLGSLVAGSAEQELAMEWIWKEGGAPRQEQLLYI